MTTANAICPECKGTKVMHGMGCPGWKPITFPCITCKATGSVPQAMLDAWIPAGNAMREDRRARGLSLREEAKRRNMDPSRLSDMEFGKVAPIPDPTVKRTTQEGGKPNAQ